MLNALEADGVRMAVVTDNQPYLRELHDGIGIARFFEAYAISAQLGCTDQQHVGRCRDKTVALTSSGSHFKRWVFARHSHPWSAWTRWASTPLVLLPVWNRSARQGVVVAAWLALNPVLFPPPRDDSAFATRAVLGEERWLEERPVSGALAINCLASAALVIAIDSARRHRRWQMTIATIATMSALLWYWREMVRFYDTRGDGQ